jgi:RNA polymerase sigma-70 factor (ECF subfamily)
MEHEEADLLVEFQSEHPEAALGMLFDQYADRIYRLAIGILGDPASAEDVVQDTFLSAIDHRMKFEGRSSLSTWLYRIATNASLSQLRKRSGEPLPDEDPVSEQEHRYSLPKEFIEWRWTPDQLLMDAELRQQLDNAIQKLPESLRVVFLLRDVQELSTEETADVIGISTGAVKVRLHRARLELREQLSEYLAESKGEKKYEL